MSSDAKKKKSSSKKSSSKKSSPKPKASQAQTAVEEPEQDGDAISSFDLGSGEEAAQSAPQSIPEGVDPEIYTQVTKKFGEGRNAFQKVMIQNLVRDLTQKPDQEREIALDMDTHVRLVNGYPTGPRTQAHPEGINQKLMVETIYGGQVLNLRATVTLDPSPSLEPPKLQILTGPDGKTYRLAVDVCQNELKHQMWRISDAYNARMQELANSLRVRAQRLKDIITPFDAAKAQEVYNSEIQFASMLTAKDSDGRSPGEVLTGFRKQRNASAGFEKMLNGPWVDDVVEVKIAELILPKLIEGKGPVTFGLRERTQNQFGTQTSQFGGAQPQAVAVAEDSSVPYEFNSPQG